MFTAKAIVEGREDSVIVQDIHLRVVKGCRDCPAWMAKAQGVYAKSEQGM
jgi:hypothetical protein